MDSEVLAQIHFTGTFNGAKCTGYLNCLLNTTQPSQLGHLQTMGLAFESLCTEKLHQAKLIAILEKCYKHKVGHVCTSFS